MTTHYLCKACRKATRQGDPSNERSEALEGRCFLCLGILQTEPFQRKLQEAVRHAAIPYQDFLQFSPSSSLLTLPADLLYRDRDIKDKVAWSQHLIKYARTELANCLESIQSEASATDSARLKELPSFVKDEEQGFLSVAVVVLPKVSRPPIRKTTKASKKRKRRTHEEISQGGDPRENLHEKLEQSGEVVWSIQSAIQPETDEWSPPESELPEDCLEFHVACWRRPFYLKSCYTKNRRDVSQTPFMVIDAGECRKRGVTSVEEQIVPAIEKYAGGISTLNNIESNGLVYGKCKFHASGREDLDVRMLLPEQSADKSAITARPFVCEVTDAFRLPSNVALSEVVKDINYGSKMEATRWYGSNPFGVGVAPGLSFCPSSSYKNLQSETEDKIKYYGCYCWCEKAVTAEQLKELTQQFPLEIEQKTPIRVLHRRSSAIRVRKVLSYQAKWLDDHHFHLSISTTAGTYVKEFVHSDLGRTVPSISSLLETRTDLLELDCEGIEMDG